MRGFGWNAALAAAWVAVTGEIAAWNILLGVAFGLGVMVFAGGAVGAPGYVQLAWRTVKLGGFFIRELVLSNLRLALDVVVPKALMQPAIVAIPLDAETDAEITVLANLITLTPGSTAIEVAPDRKTLYVHVMYPEGGDLDATRRAIKKGLERRVLEVTR
jgi:multicomponent Na+:H+ antiporter subunit E